MDVREHAESDDMLESVSNGVVSSGILFGTLIKVWNVSNNDSISILLLKFGELSDEPLKLVSWVLETCPSSKVCSIANVGIERNDSCLIVQLFGKVAIVEPGLLVFFIINKLDP